MFEAVIAVCVSLSDGPCRDQLLPGYEAESQTACLALIDTSPPNVDDLLAKGEPRCEAMGEGLAFTEIADGVFVHTGLIEEPNRANTGDVSNFGFVIGDRSVALIDAGTTRVIGERALRSIRTKTKKPISHVILTHMHPDHVFGVSVFADAGAQVVGHSRLEQAVADREANYLQSLTNLIGTIPLIGTEMRPVDLAVEEAAEIDLGGRVLSLKAWQTAHTANDLTVFDAATGTLFVGDLVFHRHIPALDGSLRGWQAVLEAMSMLEVQRIVPGHGGPSLPWPEGGEDQRRYLDVLAADTLKALDAGHRLGDAVETIAASEASMWALFGSFNPRNATVAFTELEWE